MNMVRESGSTSDKLSNFESAKTMVLNLHHVYYTVIMMSKRLFCHNPVSRGTNQPIRKSEFIQCMKVE